MIVIPLVIASIIRGLAASENLEQLKKMGLRVTLFFILTTAVAASIGLLVANAIDPGESLTSLAGSQLPTSSPAEVPATPGLQQLPDTVIGLLPGNPLDAMVEGGDAANRHFLNHLRNRPGFHGSGSGPAHARIAGIIAGNLHDSGALGDENWHLSLCSD